MKRTLRIVTWIALAPVLQPAFAADRRPPPTRSLYLPVELRLCEHLERAVLLENDVRAGLLPARRTFQFTYYPELAQVQPQVIQLRIEGVYADSEEPFVARLAVTPDGLHTARAHVQLDGTKDKATFRARLDARHQTIDFLVRCDRHCSRRKAEGQ